MPTLKYRRLRGDMIHLYSIISGVHDTYSAIQFNMSNITKTRGNQFKMQARHTHYRLRGHFFSNRIIEVWNSLPNDVVSADSINIFKNRLDRFWFNQEFKFDWKSDIAGIGSRSQKVS